MEFELWSMGLLHRALTVRPPPPPFFFNFTVSFILIFSRFFLLHLFHFRSFILYLVIFFSGIVSLLLRIFSSCGCSSSCLAIQRARWSETARALSRESIHYNIPDEAYVKEKWWMTSSDLPLIVSYYHTHSQVRWLFMQGEARRTVTSEICLLLHSWRMYFFFLSLALRKKENVYLCIWYFYCFQLLRSFMKEGNCMHWHSISCLRSSVHVMLRISIKITFPRDFKSLGNK